jgi:hypothetical protein
MTAPPLPEMAGSSPAMTDGQRPVAEAFLRCRPYPDAHDPDAHVAAPGHGAEGQVGHHQRRLVSLCEIDQGKPAFSILSLAQVPWRLGHDHLQRRPDPRLQEMSAAS